MNRKRVLINFIQALDSFSNTSEFRLFLVSDGPDVILSLLLLTWLPVKFLSFGNVDYQTMSYCHLMSMSFACLPMKTLPLYPWLRLLTLPYPLCVHASSGNSNDAVSLH